MTVSELFTYQESIYPTQYASTTKIVWVRQLEKSITDYLSMFGEATHRDAETTDNLMIDEPDLYASYISAMADFANGEYAKYNNKVQMFNAFFGDWKSEYLRNHEPIGEKAIKI